MLPVKNEAGRYLPVVLNHLATYVDGIVVLDDGSTDQTPQLCQNHPKVVRFRRLEESLFPKDEAALRQMLWEMTVELEPAWVLALDADEIFEAKIRRELPLLTRQEQYGLIHFPVYHFWGGFTHYRIDGLWNPLVSRTACLYHYQKGLNYHWPVRNLHCGRLPMEAHQSRSFLAPVNLLHLGYAKKQDHLQKYRRYLSLDPEGKYCPLAHYQSILEPHPRLRKWNGGLPLEVGS